MKYKQYSAGVDENNFSPSLSGPVVVTALYTFKEVSGVDDSKALTHNKRLSLLGEIQESSVYTISLATIPMIRDVGIVKARDIAILQALIGLMETLGGSKVVTEVLLDGRWSKKQLSYFITQTGFVNIFQGKDEEDYAIAAASIVGKVYIDSMFRGFGAFYDGIYGDHFNKGGVSREHRESLRAFGPTPFHRPRNYGRKWWRSILEDEQE